MNKTNVIIGLILVITLFVGYAAGRVVKTNEFAVQEANKNEHANHNMEMKHDHIQVAPGRLTPNVKLEAIKDSMGGYNFRVLTNNFYFTPANAGKDPVQNTGHAHLFVNDKKIGRIYGEWFYLGDDKFQTGTNTVVVSLNANNHADWVTKDGKEIVASTTIIK